jgi:L-threonylcarbamoyladenylate synthase
MNSHYSPKARIRLDSIAAVGEGFLAMSDIPTPIGAIRLASPENIKQYANQLYSALRAADNIGIETISVLVPDGSGLAEAIRDRLTKASTR